MIKTVQSVTIVVFALISYFSYGQNNMEDVVYLKNGGILRGIIIEQVPNQSIKIQTKDRNVFVFKFEEIEKMTKEYLPTDNSNEKHKLTEFKKNGFIYLAEINYCPGVGDVKMGTQIIKNFDYSFGLRTVNGYQFNEHFTLGLGLGIDQYRSATLIPISFDARATILKGKVSPIFTGNVGYAVGLNNVKSGLIINPQIGLKVYISRNAAYLFNVGYKMQASAVTYIAYVDNFGRYITTTDNANFHFITVSTGFAF